MEIDGLENLVLVVSINYFTGCSHEAGRRGFHQRLEQWLANALIESIS